MSRIRRVILDTSTLVSAALRTGSIPDQVLLRALRTCEVCTSAETLDELAQVLDRKKFDRYLDRKSRCAFVALMRRHMHLFAMRPADLAAVDPPCRDPMDNKFLALALVSEADALVSSDRDLLVLHPWRGIPIMIPAAFLV
ncbi:MAG TPA: putative toxin-antitoxin system toxin component, PIN family [Acidobacteriaceae bacterium]|jgi:putative PIN family toxin of toxin-antitoxin system|nr:putative toxin-antitoxin system toxin component, PIN family [Acidobacteriaceae bacterium]